MLWYNLMQSGDGDMRTRHAACPVLAGIKWGQWWWQWCGGGGGGGGSGGGGGGGGDGGGGSGSGGGSGGVWLHRLVSVIA